MKPNRTVAFYIKAAFEEGYYYNPDRKKFNEKWCNSDSKEIVDMLLEEDLKDKAADILLKKEILNNIEEEFNK